MKKRTHHLLLVVQRASLAMLLAFGTVSTGFAEEEPAKAGTQLMQPPATDAIQKHCSDWLKKNGNETELKSWAELSGDEYFVTHPLELVARTIAIVDEPTRKMLAGLSTMPDYKIANTLQAYQPKIGDTWMESNLRLWLGHQLSQRYLYEEALQEFVQIDSGELVDPATYFFHRAVCEHHLLQKKEGLASINSLLTECKPLPGRYRMLGELMQQSLSSLKEKSLDEITRQMTDVERRLDLGRAGDKVQVIEEKIIASLDEMIKKLEEEAGGGSGSGSGSGKGKGNGNGQGDSPAQDSSVKGSTGPGNVDNKDLGRKDNWGKLPPKDQAKAKQILGTMFPPHYRRAIEAYNRKAAQRESPTP